MAALVLEKFKPARIDFFSLVSYTLCGKFSINRAGVVCCARDKCISMMGLGLENGCLHQKSFLRRNLFMSFALCPHFPLYRCVSARAGWRSVHRLILHVEKSFFFLPFFSSQVLTQPPSLLKSAETSFFHFKFPKHWFKCALSCTLSWLSVFFSLQIYTTSNLNHIILEGFANLVWTMNFPHVTPG